eukprot:TRINITY_DN5980_c0_g2_i2.p1 TRINITY_DN5980_c0_g2~~TRINITY_DN5980_c0_g2_i2.p1  ORF type:complete len:424 (+),score=73.45 TRINITY_DN5980_c0_g2_i2:71-1273(+)
MCIRDRYQRRVHGESREKRLMILLPFALILTFAVALDNGVGVQPPMGWSSWNYFACNINETIIRETADALISTGLAAAGYVYVNIDDCWAKYRDNQGWIHEDEKAFPSGMKALGDYIHSKGLKYGLYSDAGRKTCAGRPGSLFHEEKDAQKYKEWGADYLKYDNCQSYGWLFPSWRYIRMRDALNATGRPIYFGMCEWGLQQPSRWARPIANSWRTTQDIKDTWASFLHIVDKQVPFTSYAAPGGWNDPDMLEVGNGGMTTSEYEAQFALWALLKAPLFVGCDVRNMSNDTRRILLNRDLIAINQDELGISGRRIWKKGDAEVWGGPLSGGAVAVIFFNRGELQETISATFEEIGYGHNPALVRDLYQQKDLGIYRGSLTFTVPPHSVVVLRLNLSLIHI